MKNKLHLLLCIFILSGCYKTSPTHWNTNRGRDVIRSKETIHNGTRLDLNADIERGSLTIKAVDIPQCRVAENGYPIIKESGLENSHSWPGAVAGVGMMAGGVGMMAYGFSGNDDASTDEKSTRLVVALSGIGVTAIGGWLLGKCALSINGCGPDEELETREHNGQPFKRWDDDEEKTDCSGSSPQNSGIVPLSIVASFPQTEKILEWTPSTDASGVASLAIVEDIRNVGAHCGEASIVFTSSASNSTPSNDSPTSPSQARDNTVKKVFKLKPARVQSPEIIKDVIAWNIANECATEKRNKCINPKSTMVRDQCMRNCNSEQGAEECQVNFESQNVSGLTSDERSILEAKYKTCVLGFAVDTSKANSCRNTCVERTFDKLCPRGW